MKSLFILGDNSQLCKAELENYFAARSWKFEIADEGRNAVVAEIEELKKEITHIKKVFLMCELIDAVLPREQRHPDVFDLIERASRNIINNEKNILYFQAKLLTLLGFWNPKFAFKSEDHLDQYTEQIIERKLKSRHIFDS